MSTKLLFIISVLFPFLLFSSCGEEKVEEGPEAPIFELDPSYLKIDVAKEGGIKKIPIKTNIDWAKLTFSSNQEWCTVSKDDVEKDHLKLTFEKSEAAYVRSAEIKINSSVKNYTIVAQQLGYGAQILATATTTKFGVAGGTTEIKVTSNVKYAVSQSAKSEWLTDITRKGLEESVSSWNVKANPLTEARTAIIYFKEIDGKAKDSCIITQDGKVNIDIPVTGVTVDKATLSLEVNKTSTLVATVAPENATNKNVTWKSSDNTIATVNEAGVVTAKAIGTATITSTASTQTATCEVIVTKAPNVDVTKITIDPTTLSLEVNKTSTLIAEVFPENATDKSVTWKSSDETIATVDANGAVTAKADGTATITATAGTQTATCTVTTVVIPVTGLTIDPTTLDLSVNKTTTITATVTPADASYKDVVWNSSNSDIATVDAAGVVTAKAIGTATITATIDTYSVTCLVTITKSPSGENEGVTEGDGIF